MNLQILFICFLAIFSNVNTISIDGKPYVETNSRLKRSDDTTEDAITEGNGEPTESKETHCPHQEIDCLKCYTEADDDLKKNICSYEFVAEVSLNGVEECGQLDIKNTIKDNFLNSPKVVYSMRNGCADCRDLFNQTVTLLTKHSTYNISVDGFQFNSETILIKGLSPIQDCSEPIQSSESPLDSSSETTSELPSSPTLEELFVTTVSSGDEFTPETDTTTQTSDNTSAIDITEQNYWTDETPTDSPFGNNWFNNILNFQGINETDNELTRRRVDNPGYNPSLYGFRPPNPMNGYNGGYPSRPNHIYNAPQNRYEYPHTQNEYSSPQYSPYQKPPGYLTTGYFNAQSLQYGAGKPPAVNPNYYYSTQNRPNNGPHYRPAQLNPRPTYYPKGTNYRSNYTIPFNTPPNVHPMASYNRTYPPNQPFVNYGDRQQYPVYQRPPYFADGIRPQQPYNNRQNYGIQPNFTSNYNNSAYSGPTQGYNAYPMQSQNSYNNYSNVNNNYRQNYNQQMPYNQQNTSVYSYNRQPNYSPQNQQYSGGFGNNYNIPRLNYTNKNQNTYQAPLYGNNQVNNSYNNSNTTYGSKSPYSYGQQSNNYNNQQINAYDNEHQPYYESLYNQNYTNNANYGPQSSYNTQQNYANYNQQTNNRNYGQLQPQLSSNSYSNQNNRQTYQSNGQPTQAYGQINQQSNYNIGSQRYNSSQTYSNQSPAKDYNNNYNNQNNGYSQQNSETYTTQSYDTNSYGQQSDNNYDDNSQYKRSFGPMFRRQQSNFNPDLIASSSNQMVNHIQLKTSCLSNPIPCPTCLTDVVEKSFLETICEFPYIFEATVGDSNETMNVMNGNQMNVSDAHSLCQIMSIKSAIKSPTDITGQQLFYSINPKCKCNEKAVIVFTKTLDLDDNYLSLEVSYSNSEDVERILNEKQCK